MTIPSFVRSAGFRLTALASGLFLICMMAVIAFIYLSVREDMEDQLRDQVLAETSQLIGDYRDDGLDELRHDISERLDRNPGTRLRYTLENADGVALFDRLSLPEQAGWSRLETSGGTRLILLRTDLRDGYALGVAADTRSISDAVGALRHAFLIVVVPMILLAIISGAFLSHRFLARVERLKQTADLIGGGALSARLELSGSGDDFDGLIETINRMLDRIEELVDDVRHVSVNIAHDLRSPLGRLRQRLETLCARQPDDRLRDDTGDAIELLDRTLETFSAILRIAELDSGATKISGERVNLPALLENLQETYEPVATEQGSHIRLGASAPVSIEGDRPLLMQMLVNLIENSIRHNSQGTEITLSCGRDGDASFLEVSDTGRGIPELEMQQVLKPFRRLDASRSTPGSGLGLSLAASIAARHGATLTLADNQPGLRAIIRFP